jgi:hypothetical protein
VHGWSVVFVLVVEVDAGGGQHDEDRCGDQVDVEAERRPPACIGDIVAALLQRSLSPWPVKPSTSSHADPVTAAAESTTKSPRDAALDCQDDRPAATTKPM